MMNVTNNSSEGNMNLLKDSQGYQSLKKAVTKDCKESKGEFNPNGCIKKCPGSNCCHAYCNTFKWILDRADHYSKSLGIPIEQILDGWESKRDYWYMNYYQDCNQPLLTVERIRVFETVDDFKKSLKGKGFRCPACGGISSHPMVCNSGIQFNRKTCDWKAYGLFGALGKGIFVFVKSEVQGYTIFTPLSYEGSL